MKKSSFIILSGFIGIFLLSNILPNYFLPTDILHTIPIFGQWQRPQNSLLADPVFQFEPWRIFIRSQLSQGIFPLWNDMNGKGAPFLANMQSAVFFPLNFLYYFLPQRNALYLVPFLKMYLFGLFSYLYFRSLSLRPITSVIGGFLTASSGFFMFWLLWPHTNVFLFFPLVLYLTEKIRKNDSYRYYIFLIFAYFLALLGGHPETLFHIVLLHGFYILFRLKNNPKKILMCFLSICAGFLLGSFQLFPFGEYVLHSYALTQRPGLENNFFLPPAGFVYNIVPYILGAPHLPFYHPLDNTNFQEVAGGYVGEVVFLLGIWGMTAYRSEKALIRFWTILVVFIWLIVYKIWPFWLLTKLPLLNNTANNRLIGIAGFGIIVIFLFSLEKILKNGMNFWVKRVVGVVSILLIGGFAFGTFVLTNMKFPQLEKYHEFMIFSFNHIVFMSFSTILFFLLVILIHKKKISQLFLYIPIFLQTILLYWNYNPTSQVKDYYPKNDLLKKLQIIPSGTLLEVGNPSIPQDINLVYHLDHAQNYDALEVNNYRKEFDKAFPIKNQWKKVEDPQLGSLQKFGIKYIISDYDINLGKNILQPKNTAVLAPFIQNKNLIYNFSAKESLNVQFLRLLPATFNRKNNCTVQILLLETDSQKEIAKNKLRCEETFNNMYFTLPFNALLEKDTLYSIIFSSNTADANNSISFFGEKGKPYIELLTQQQKNQYALLEKNRYAYLWEVPNISDIIFADPYKVLYKTSTNIQLELTSSKNQNIEIKKTYYPGWIATIDGKNTAIDNSNPFMKVTIPAGYHVFSLTYRPFSFLIGLFISGLTLLVIIIFVAREEKKHECFGDVIKEWNSRIKLIKDPWWHHLIVGSFGLLVSLASFVSFVYLVPLHFSYPFTTSINWLTLHKYAKAQDYFYVFVGSLWIILVTLLVWGGWVWKKIKK